ncbi:MAG TPA: GNAT family N-acetyltransferase [Candidatus Binataceae bacterium]
MASLSVEIIDAVTPPLVATARTLIIEYAGSLEIDLSFQDFDREIATLPGDYALPWGCLLLAMREGAPVGCIALRRLEEAICEMKRMWVTPEFRGVGIGLKLAGEVIKRARRIGYRAMRLDTLASMRSALAIYESLGFHHIDAYRYNPEPNAVYLELDLSAE